MSDLPEVPPARSPDDLPDGFWVGEDSAESEPELKDESGEEDDE